MTAKDGVAWFEQVAEEAIQRHVGGSSVNWLDRGTEHPHRIALSVHVHSLQDCLAHLRHGFQQHSVQVCPPLLPTDIAAERVYARLHLTTQHELFGVYVILNAPDCVVAAVCLICCL